MLNSFKYYRRNKGGYWVKTAFRGWITKQQYEIYLSYGFDPVILEEEYYKTIAEKKEAYQKASQTNKNKSYTILKKTKMCANGCGRIGLCEYDGEMYCNSCWDKKAGLE